MPSSKSSMTSQIMRRMITMANRGLHKSRIARSLRYASHTTMAMTVMWQPQYGTNLSYIICKILSKRPSKSF
uniref:Uncharacterized protein n=1 Tax=Uncultured archaeon GZfos26G2 TaxID=3386331 RepID=Q64CW8_UNCAG|nr:hypothetical protein GZ19C8_20 [uncultured archaeon GZfos19C8]